VAGSGRNGKETVIGAASEAIGEAHIVSL